MSDADELDELVYETKVPSNKTHSGYEVSFDPDYLKAAIAAYSRTQTEAVLERLKVQQETCYDCQHDNPNLDEPIPYVNLSAIDAELERLRSGA